MGIAEQTLTIDNAPAYERKLISDLPQFVANTLSLTAQHDAIAYAWAKMPTAFRWQCMAIAYRQSPADFKDVDQSVEWYALGKNQKNVLRRVIIQTLDAAVEAFGRTEITQRVLPSLVESVKARAAA